VFGTAGAGLLNEANQTQTTMEALYGVKQQRNSAYIGTKFDEFNATVRLVKQDIRFVELLDTVTLTNMAVKGVKSMVTFANSTSTLAAFSDGSPALSRADRGAKGGRAYYAAFMPGDVTVLVLAPGATGPCK
jgi:hypothetical protein